MSPRDPHPAPARLARPPYPWAVPQAALETDRKLDAWGLNVWLDFTDASLFDIKSAIEECTKISILISPADQHDAERKISIEFQDVRPREFLNLVLARFGMIFAVREDGTVLVGKAEHVQELPHLREASALAHARRLGAGDESPASLLEKEYPVLVEQMKECPLSMSFTDAPLTDVISFVREFTGDNIRIDSSWISSNVANPPRVTLHAEGTSYYEILREIARQTGGDFEMGVGALVILGPQLAARRKEEREAVRVRALAILERRADLHTAEVEAYRLPELLRSRLGVEAILDEAVWNRPQPIALSTGAQSVRETMDAIAARNGLRWRLLDGVFYLF